MAATQPTPESSLSTPRIVVSPWIVLLVVAMGFFMILLDTTIVNVAIPSMITGLQASLDQILWVLNGYILTLSVLLITAGRMGDMFGPKKMFLGGLALFTLASFACGLAQSPDQLILFRVIQGVGAAVLMPQSLSIITSIFPPQQRGAAFGVWAAVAGLAAVAGPTLGGFLVTGFSWRAIFFVNVPIGIAAIVLANLMMPEFTLHRKHRLDLVGVVLATAGLFAGVFALIEGQRYDWGPITSFGSFDIGGIHASIVSIPTMLLASVVLLAAFVVLEARQEEPLLPLSLFRDRNFSVANAISAIVAFGLFGLFLPLTIFLQTILGLSALQAGIALVPMSLTSMLISPFIGRLTDRINGKYILFVGLVLFATGMGLVTWVASLHSTGASFTLPLILAGLGMGCTFAPLVTLAMRDVAPTQAGAASGFINTIRQVGGTVGSSVVGAVLQHQLATEMSSRAAAAASQVGRAATAAHLPPSAVAHLKSDFVTTLSQASKQGFHLGRGQAGSSATPVPHNTPPALAHQLATIGQQVFQHSFLNAMKPSLALAIGVMLFGALVTTLLRGSGPARREERAPERARGLSPVAE